MGKKPSINLSALTKPECEYFRENCNFTEDERKVFDFRAKGNSIVQISFAIGMSERSISRRIQSINQKINKVKQ